MESGQTRGVPLGASLDRHLWLSGWGRPRRSWQQLSHASLFCSWVGGYSRTWIDFSMSLPARGGNTFRGCWSVHALRGLHLSTVRYLLECWGPPKARSPWRGPPCRRPAPRSPFVGLLSAQGVPLAALTPEFLAVSQLRTGSAWLQADVGQAQPATEQPVDGSIGGSSHRGFLELSPFHIHSLGPLVLQEHLCHTGTGWGSREPALGTGKKPIMETVPRAAKKDAVSTSQGRHVSCNLSKGEEKV